MSRIRVGKVRAALKGRELHAALGRKGFSQAELARRLGVLTGRINRFMKLKGHLPLSIAKKVAAIVEVPFGDLFVTIELRLAEVPTEPAKEEEPTPVAATVPAKAA